MFMLGIQTSAVDHSRAYSWRFGHWRMVLEIVAAKAFGAWYHWELGGGLDETSLLRLTLGLLVVL
jgi:hypothetical protein